MNFLPVVLEATANHIMLSVHKMFKHTLKILQDLLQDFSREFDHFLDARCYKVKMFVRRQGFFFQI